MKSYLIGVLLLCLTHQVKSAWKCAGENGHGPGEPAPSTKRPQMEPDYFCLFDTSRYPVDYRGTLMTASVAVGDTQRINSPCGVEKDGDYPDYKIDHDMLYTQLNKRFNWTYEVEMCNSTIDLVNEHTVAVPAPGALYFTLVASCRDSNNGVHLKIKSRPLPFQFPDLDHCEPMELLLPIRNRKTDDYWFTNVTKGEDDLWENYFNPGVFNIGFAGKIQPAFHGMKGKDFASSLFQGEYSHSNISWDDPYVNYTWYKLMDKLTKIKGETVGFSWWDVFTSPARATLKPPDLGMEISKYYLSRHFGIYWGQLGKIHENSAAKYFELVGICGDVTYYSGWIFSRAYTLDKVKCTRGGAKTGKPNITDCQKCEDDFSKCGVADVETFKKEHLEYIA